ncbi:MAG TPA: shikimate dehydrogenase [Rhizomicrobium sp.]|nr:shikimate dehydrogenase [Rhizomicrobium sp.]
MKRAGVIGWPIEHSLSPVLHGHWLKAYDIDGAMIPLAAKTEDFAAVIDGVRRAGFQGVNVTVPHKEAAFALAHKLDKGARICGAANLLIFNGNEIEGRNTDHSGLHVSILKAMDGNPFKGKTAVLLGAGGAARGAILALDSFGFSQVHILNRDEARAKTLAASLATEIEAKLIAGGLTDWKSSAGNAALVVNSTSAGMSAHPPLDIDLAALPKSAAVCDIVYNPLETKLLKDAAARGHKTIDGLGMLMHQAVPSFEAFFGVRPQVTPALRETLEKVLRARQ